MKNLQPISTSWNQTQASKMFTIFALFASLFSCLGADHFCPNSYELEVDFTDRSHQDERLIVSKFGRNSRELRDIVTGVW